jgi:hypothetical protein
MSTWASKVIRSPYSNRVPSSSPNAYIQVSFVLEASTEDQQLCLNSVVDEHTKPRRFPSCEPSQESARPLQYLKDTSMQKQLVV